MKMLLFFILSIVFMLSLAYGLLIATLKFNQSAEKTTLYFGVVSIRASEAIDSQTFICRWERITFPPACENFSITHEPGECRLGAAYTKRNPLGYILDRYTSHFVTTANPTQLMRTIAESSEITTERYPEIYKRLSSQDRRPGDSVVHSYYDQARALAYQINETKRCHDFYIHKMRITP